MMAARALPRPDPASNLRAWVGARMVGAPVSPTSQKRRSTCGPAAAESVLRYFGRSVQEGALAREMGTTDEEGTPRMSAMERAFTSRGLTVQRRTDLTADSIKALLGKGALVVLVIQAWSGRSTYDGNTWEDGHFVVPVAVDADTVVFVDPAAPYVRSWLTREQLDQRWRSYDREGTYRKGFGLVVTGQPRARVALANLPPIPMR